MTHAEKLEAAQTEVGKDTPQSSPLRLRLKVKTDVKAGPGGYPGAGDVQDNGSWS